MNIGFRGPDYFASKSLASMKTLPTTHTEFKVDFSLQCELHLPSGLDTRLKADIKSLTGIIKQ